MVLRAIFFDFYSVWTPDKFSEYLTLAQQLGPTVVGDLSAIVEQYYMGEVTLEYVADSFRFRLSRPDIDIEQFVIHENDIQPAIVDFMRNLHGHFVKLGVLANLGVQEYQVLTSFNNNNQLFEVITGPYPLRLRLPLLSQEVFAKALEAIGEPARSCLVVSGNQAYLEFAKSLGMTTILFQGFPALQEELYKLVSTEVN